MEPTDRDLMLCLQRGDPTALGVLYERHQSRLHNYFRRLTRDDQVSRDLLQNVFLRILRFRNSYRERGEFRVWLYRLARNCWVDHRRATSGEPTALEPFVDLPARGPDPLDRFEQKQRAALVRRALDALSPEQREVLVLSRYEEFKAPQIAELLDCSPGAVRVRIHRALLELRRQIDLCCKEAAP